MNNLILIFLILRSKILALDSFTCIFRSYSIFLSIFNFIKLVYALYETYLLFIKVERSRVFYIFSSALRLGGQKYEEKRKRGDWGG